MGVYKIVKSFQGGYNVYFSKMSPLKKLKKDCWQYQLEEWGEHTNGGHAYGYNITAKRIRKIPELRWVKVRSFSTRSGFCFKRRIKIFRGSHYSCVPRIFLKFNKYYLIPLKKRICK
jgi:hypothetical protein